MPLFGKPESVEALVFVLSKEGLKHHSFPTEQLPTFTGATDITQTVKSHQLDAQTWFMLGDKYAKWTALPKVAFVLTSQQSAANGTTAFQYALAYLRDVWKYPQDKMVKLEYTIVQDGTFSGQDGMRLVIVGHLTENLSFSTKARYTP